MNAHLPETICVEVQNCSNAVFAWDPNSPSHVVSIGIACGLTVADYNCANNAYLVYQI